MTQETNFQEQEIIEPTSQEEAEAALATEEILEQTDTQPETDDPSELKRLLKEKNEEATDHYNRSLRLQADYDNLRRRSRLEREELLKYGAEHLINGLLPVLDNFERALASTGDGGEKFVSGVEMIYRQLSEVMKGEGLEVIPAKGEQFDPKLHEAVMQVEDTGQPENTVVQELRRGYYLKGKVIRPSMVQVAKS